MVKRLFLLILQNNYAFKEKFLPDEILGLFNKRGFTRAESEKEKEILQQHDFYDFMEKNLKNYPMQDEDIDDFIDLYIATDLELFEKYFKDFKLLFNESVKYVKKVDKNGKEKTHLEPSDWLVSLDKDKVVYEAIFNGIKEVDKILTTIKSQFDNANLPRKEYFKQINIEIFQEPMDKVNNKNIKPFFDKHSLDFQAMCNLIGNISNFQLKQLRRYFNDKEMQKSDSWKEKELHRITWRFIQSWHPKNDEDKKRQKENLNSLKHWEDPDRKNIIEFLTTTEPKNTIPPYDDMNNRGAVKCQTLRLSESYLDIHLPNWRNITQKLASENQKENLKDATVKKWSEDNTLLHRILDTSKEIDPYKLRDDDINNYIDMLSKDDAEDLKKFAKDYYELIRTKVRTGIWAEAKDKNGKLILDDKNNMLKVCGKNPPHKAKQLHNLVSNVLGFEISEEKLGFNDKKKDEKNFNEIIWNPKSGKKLKTYCEKIEKARKSVGNRFKKLSEIILELENEKLDDKDKKFKKTIQELNKDLSWATKTIKDFFELDDHQIKWFNNLFSLAQLYTILEKQRSGFNKTCVCCTIENRYRTTVKTHNETTGEVYKKLTANCQRLPADTQRPFSGKIERYIDKLGYEIAKIKAKELENIQDEKIDLKIILEQNVFAYEESLKKTKANPDKTSKEKVINTKEDIKKLENELKKSYDRIDKDTNEKNERIRQFNSICPYSGLDIGSNSEIDHILSRKHTLDNFGTVFNGEGNLINAHIQGNQNKGKERKKLSQIHSRYKQEIFNATNDKQIIDFIDKEIKSIKRYKTFTLLTNSQQKAFKNALFLFEERPDIYEKVVDWLRTDQSSRVNGTQKYLAKKIQEKLKAMLPSKEFDFEFILADANDVHDLRINKYQLPEKPKDSKQEAHSHTIDAVMSLISVWDKVFKVEKPTQQDILKFANVENWSAINNEFLTKGKSTNQKIEEMIQTQDFSQKNIRQVFSKPIFKDESIGERYKPFIEFQNKFYIGYPKTVKGGYDVSFCQEMGSKNDITKFQTIVQDRELCDLTKDNQFIKIYSINKQNINELSNQFFNLNYQNLDETKKTKSDLVEYIINNSKYYVKKTSVINAPQFIAKETMKQYPFFDDWQRFHQAYTKRLGNEPKTKKDNGKLVYDISGIEDLWIDFCKEYFNIKTKENRNKARKEFSIIALTSAPGTVFRIKRKTPKGYIYQATAIDNQQISGDYANILLQGNSKSLALAGQKPTSDLKKELSVKETKDIRDINLEPSKFFKDGFDFSSIEVILNKTEATVKNFPRVVINRKLKQLIFKTLFEKKEGKRQKQKTSISLKEKSVLKDELKKLLKKTINTTVRDGNISNIEISKKTVNFTLPFKSKDLAKLLDD